MPEVIQDWIRSLHHFIFLRNFLGFNLQLLPLGFLIMGPFKANISRRRLNLFRLTYVITLAVYMLAVMLTEMSYFPENGSHANPGVWITILIFKGSIVVLFLAFMKLVRAEFFYKLSVFLLVANYRLIMTNMINLYVKYFPVDNMKLGYSYRADVLVVYTAVMLLTYPLMKYVVRKMSDMIIALPTSAFKRPVFILIPVISLLYLGCLFVYIALTDHFDNHILFFIGLSYAFITSMHIMLFSMVREIILRYENYLQIYTLRSTYEKMQRQIERTRVVKHETRSRIAYLRLCLQNKEYAKAENYLAKLSEIPALNEPLLYCKDLFLNGIFNYVMSDEKAKGLSLETKLQTENYAPMTRIEISSVLINLLANAVRELSQLPPKSRGEDKVISLAMTRAGGQLLIACRNRLLHEINVDDSKKIISHYHTGNPEHGLGLNIVRGIAEKYGGRLNIIHNEYFTVSLFIPLPDAGAPGEQKA